MVIRLAFQELGDPYGWGSADGKRDCSSYVKDIYACFGFVLPRNSRLQQSMPGTAEDITENFANSIVSINQVTVNSLNVKRGNGNTWLQELNAIASFKLTK